MDITKQSVEKYEDIEKNGTLYIQLRTDYENLIDNCIKIHDLISLQKYIREFMELNKKYNKALITTELNRMEHICNAMHNESIYHLPLFWDTKINMRELIDKYDKTIFMLRRLIFELPEIYKTEALNYLTNISPFIVKEIYRDATTIIGMEDYIFFTLAKEHLTINNKLYALLFLKNMSNKNDKTKSLISQLESITSVSDII